MEIENLSQKNLGQPVHSSASLLGAAGTGHTAVDQKKSVFQY